LHQSYFHRVHVALLCSFPRYQSLLLFLSHCYTSGFSPQRTSNQSRSQTSHLLNKPYTTLPLFNISKLKLDRFDNCHYDWKFDVILRTRRQSTSSLQNFIRVSDKLQSSWLPTVSVYNPPFASVNLFYESLRFLQNIH
jgi:hypothetical protein